MLSGNALVTNLKVSSVLNGVHDVTCKQTIGYLELRTSTENDHLAFHVDVVSLTDAQQFHASSLLNAYFVTIATNYRIHAKNAVNT